MYRMRMGTEDLVGLRIRNLRLDARETLAQTAQATGVSESLLSRIENGHRRPAGLLLERLSAHFSVPLESFAADVVPLPARPARRVSETAWPLGGTMRVDASAAGALVLADLAISTALGQLREALEGGDHVDRYRASRSLAGLASQPLEMLHDVCLRDTDPMVREAARQLLDTLVEAYVEAQSA